MNQKSNDKPTKVLPTDRLKLPKQLDIIRTYGILYSQTGSAITPERVGEIVGLKASTVSLMNAFLTENRFLKKTPEGFIPAESVLEFAQRFEWNQEAAPTALASLLSETWFAQVVIRKLRFDPRDEMELVTDLARECNAQTKYRDQLSLLVEYLHISGLVERDETTIRVSPKKTIVKEEEPPRSKSVHSSEASQSVSTSFSKPTQGLVQFHVNVKVDMAEMEAWSPDRISAFFGGIAQVLAAKNAIEGKEGGEP